MVKQKFLDASHPFLKDILDFLAVSQSKFLDGFSGHCHYISFGKSQSDHSGCEMGCVFKIRLHTIGWFRQHFLSRTTAQTHVYHTGNVVCRGKTLHSKMFNETCSCSDALYRSLDKRDPAQNCRHRMPRFVHGSKMYFFGRPFLPLRIFSQHHHCTRLGKMREFDFLTAATRKSYSPVDHCDQVGR